MQIVKGGILTCTSVSVALPFAYCNGPLLNNHQLDPNIATAQIICQSITGSFANVIASQAEGTVAPLASSNGAWFLKYAGAIAHMTDLGCAIIWGG